MKKRLTEIYVANTGKTYEELEAVMDRDSIFPAEEAVAFGFADKVILNRDF